MIVSVLFILFLILWALSLLPTVNDRLGGYGGWLPWLCVALLALKLGVFAGL